MCCALLTLQTVSGVLPAAHVKRCYSCPAGVLRAAHVKYDAWLVTSCRESHWSGSSPARSAARLSCSCVRLNSLSVLLASFLRGGAGEGELTQHLARLAPEGGGGRWGEHGGERGKR